MHHSRLFACSGKVNKEKGLALSVMRLHHCQLYRLGRFLVVIVVVVVVFPPHLLNSHYTGPGVSVPNVTCRCICIGTSDRLGEAVV
jgi:hypothetical protein